MVAEGGRPASYQARIEPAGRVTDQVNGVAGCLLGVVLNLDHRTSERRIGVEGINPVSRVGIYTHGGCRRFARIAVGLGQSYGSVAQQKTNRERAGNDPRQHVK